MEKMSKPQTQNTKLLCPKQHIFVPSAAQTSKHARNLLHFGYASVACTETATWQMFMSWTLALVSKFSSLQSTLCVNICPALQWQSKVYLYPSRSVQTLWISFRCFIPNNRVKHLKTRGISVLRCFFGAFHKSWKWINENIRPQLGSWEDLSFEENQELPGNCFDYKMTGCHNQEIRVWGTTDFSSRREKIPDVNCSRDWVLKTSTAKESLKTLIFVLEPTKHLWPFSFRTYREI